MLPALFSCAQGDKCNGRKSQQTAAGTAGFFDTTIKIYLNFLFPTVEVDKNKVNYLRGHDTMGIFGSLFETVTDLEDQTQILQRRAYGVIEVRDQEFFSVRLRPFPKIISLAEIRRRGSRQQSGTSTARTDRVMLFYNQPIFHQNFLALKYLQSSSGCSLASIALALSVLDYIAKIKNTAAIVTEITNDKIQDRHLAHFGWESHCPDSPRRHWIKRFYGEYPDRFLFRTESRSETDKADLQETAEPVLI